MKSHLQNGEFFKWKECHAPMKSTGQKSAGLRRDKIAMRMRELIDPSKIDQNQRRNRRIDRQ
jgi:hypothetical protein